MDCKLLKYKTKNNEFEIESFTKIKKISNVKFNYKICSEACKSGCRNFNMKYSCPPLSPSFDKVSESYDYIVVNALRIQTKFYRQSYNTIRMINVVEKSIQRKMFNYVLDTKDNLDLYALENGSCRLCKICNYQKKLPCKYPNKARCSLEATGVDVNNLVNTSFGFNLNWYYKDIKNNFPDYLCTVGGILTNKPKDIIFVFNFDKYETEAILNSELIK